MSEFQEPILTIYNSSAGSGKTYTLATEFIRFALLDDKNYRRILAITFTNKATAEMKERILKFLKALKNNSDAQLMQLMKEKTGFSEKIISSRADIVLSNILHNYSFFSVNTIDSFFQRLIKSFAAELNIYINYELLLDPQEVVDWVVDEMMERSFDDKKLKDWIQKYVDYKIESESSIFNIKEIFHNISKDIFNNNERAKIEKNHELLGDLSNVNKLLDQHQSRISSFEKQMNEFALKGLSVYQKNNLSTNDFSYKAGGVGGVFDKITIKSKNYDFGSRILAAKEEPQKWLPKGKDELLSVVELELHPLLNKIVEFKEEKFSEYQTSKEILKNIYAFGLTNQLEKLKEEYIKENNLLLLSDSVNHISDLIKEDEDTPFLYDKIGTYFRYILLDESQDTSQSQWNNLLPMVKNCLSEGGEVIVVGDVKQSIYRWRGGDINLLVKGIKENVYPFKVVDKNLITNYRSSKVVVESNNELLEKCLNTLTNNGFSNLDEYYSVFKQDAHSSAKGYVTYSRINSDRDFVEQSLDKTLLRVNELINESNFKYKDITILVRKNSESAMVAEFLKTHNIPVLSSEALYIQNSAEIKFVIALLKITLSLKDDISKALVFNYLKLDLSSLKSDEFYAELPQEFSSRLDEISKLDCYSAIEILISIFKIQDKSSAYFIELLNLVLDFSSKYSPSIASFIEYWDENIVEGKHSINIPAGENAVNIVSVHKSKGLEFPIVIIPFANWSIKPHGKSTFWFEDKEDSKLHYPLNYTNNLEETVFNEQFKDELSLNVLDGMNEFYVAITRAAEQLHIHIDNPKPPKTAPKEIVINDISKMLNLSLSSQFSDEQSVIEIGEKYISESIEEVVSGNISVSSLVVNSNQSEIALIHKEDDEARREGKLLHSVMEQILKLSDWDLVKEKLVLSGEADDKTIKSIEEIVTQVFEIEKYKELVNGDYKVLSEKEIYSSLDNRSYIPDRIFAKKDTAFIIDFKSRYNESSEKKYNKQLLSYKRLLLEMGFNHVEPYILYLEEAQLTEVN